MIHFQRTNGLNMCFGFRCDMSYCSTNLILLYSFLCVRCQGTHNDGLGLACPWPFRSKCLARAPAVAMALAIAAICWTSCLGPLEATHRGLPSPIKGAHLLDLCDGPVSVAKVPRTSGRPAPADVDYLDLLGLTPGSVVVVPAVATCSSASSTAPTTSGSPPDLESLARARALQLERLKRARQANTLKSLQKAKVTAEKQAAAAAAAWSSAAASLPQPQLSAFWAGAGVYDRVGGNFKCLGLLEPHS